MDTVEGNGQATKGVIGRAAMAAALVGAYLLASAGPISSSVRGGPLLGPLASKAAAAPAQQPLEGYHLAETWTGRQAADEVPRLVRAGGLTPAGDDTLFAVDSGARVIYHLTDGGRRLGVWRVEPSVGEPRDVAAGAGKVFVVGDKGGEIRSYSGSLITTLPVTDALAVSLGPDGRAYTLEHRPGPPAHYVIGVYSSDGAPLETWATVLSTFRQPRKLDVGRDGRIYLAADGVIYVLGPAPGSSPPEGRVVAQLKPQGHLVGPELLDLALVDDEVFGLQSGTVIGWALGADWAPELDSRGRIVRSRTAGVIPVSEGSAVSLAVGPKSALLIFLSRPNRQILARVSDRRTLDGELTLGHLDAEDLLGQMEAPRRLGLSLAGGAFVLDSLARVQLWLDGGIPSNQWLTEAAPVDVASGEEPCVIFDHEIVCLSGAVDSPVDVPDSWLVAVDGNANRLVALDVVSQRLRIFERGARPKLLASWPLAAYGSFFAGGDVAMDEAYVYVADRLTQQIDVWAMDGTIRPPITAVVGTPLRVVARAGSLFVLTAQGWIWKVDLATSGVKAAWPLPEGSTPTDLAAAGNGRVYVTDSRSNNVLVFEPGGAAVPVLPSRPAPRCRVELVRDLSRQPACPNENLRVQLTVGGGCPPAEGPVDLILAFDTSTSMSGYALGEAQAAAVELLGGLRAADSRVGVVSFGDTAKVVAALSDDLRAILWSISSLRLSGHTSVLAGLQAAETELTSPRVRTQTARAVVVLTDGQSPADGVEAIVNRLAGAGIGVYFVGVGESAAGDGLARLAGGRGQALLRPGPGELTAIAGTLQAYREMATLLERGSLEVELPEGTDPVAGSIQPPAKQLGDRLVWTLGATAPGARFSYMLKPDAGAESLPLGGAMLSYSDTLTNPGQASVPALALDVAAACRRFLFLPRAWR